MASFEVFKLLKFKKDLHFTYIFIRPFEKRSYDVIPLGIRPSVCPSVNFFVSVKLLLQFMSD